MLSIASLTVVLSLLLVSYAFRLSTRKSSSQFSLTMAGGK